MWEPAVKPVQNPLAWRGMPAYPSIMRRRVMACFLLVVPSWVLPSCGLIRAPFRVAGAVVDSGYRAGKKVAGKTAKALKKDPQTKAPEKANPNPAEPEQRTWSDDQAADALPDPLPESGGPLPAPDLPADGPLDALPPLPEELPPL